MGSWKDWIKQYGWVVVVGVVGTGLLVYGVWEEIKPREVRVEIVSGESANRQIGDSAKQIVVDIAGAVENPGVYRLASGSRIGEALVAVGLDESCVPVTGFSTMGREVTGRLVYWGG